MVTSSALTLPAATFQWPLTPSLRRGSSLRSIKSHRWICAARASAEKIHCPAGVSEIKPASDVPLFSVPSSVNTPAQQPEQVRKRNFFPVHRDLRRLQSRRSSRDVSLHPHGSRRLQDHSAAPRLRFEAKLPATRR